MLWCGKIGVFGVPAIMRPLMIESLSGTRSSHRWQSEPAKTDPLNTRLIFESAGEWGIPALQPCHAIPDRLAAWSDPKARADAAQNSGALHFFLDDYRFEKVWTRPEATYERVAEVGTALGPDFSMWRHMPRAMQLWQVYRARWCAAFWQHLGVDVIPTATWGDRDTYDFAFDGLPYRANIAVSALGLRKDGRQLFERGLDALIERCAPQLLLCYGELPVPASVPTRIYPTFWDTRRPELNRAGG